MNTNPHLGNVTAETANSMKILIVSDIHAPYQSDKALDKVMSVIKEEKPDYLINLGDMVDLDIISKFKDTSTGYAKGDTVIDQTIEAWGILEEMITVAKKANKKCKGVFIEGNHDHRFNLHLKKHRELAGVTNLAKLLQTKELGYSHIPYGQTYTLGGFTFLHGHYACANTAKKHLDMMKTNLVFGHVHTPSTYFGTASGTKPVAYGVGCLCKLEMDYLNGKPTNWVNSIGLLETGKQSQFRHIIL